jgi:biopolymer transport protein ExbD
MGAKLAAASGRYTVEQNADINVTPFVDVMLVLLIIFMVAIPPATTAIKIDMPPPSHADGKKPPVFISVMGPDDIYVGGQKSSKARLIGDLIAALDSRDPYTERVLVRGDKDIDYSDFIGVLNELQQNGFVHVGLINEDVEG